MFTRFVPSVALLLATLIHAPARAQESWQVLKFGADEAGYVHSVTKPVELGGAAAFETTTEVSLTVRRMKQEIGISTTSVVTEDARGQIARSTYTQVMSGTPAVYTGAVVGDEFHYSVEGAGAKREFTIDWPDDVPGPRESMRRLVATQFKPGATLKSMQHEFSLGDPCESIVTVGKTEDVMVDGKSMRLHRVVQKAAGLPETTSWVDDRGMAMKTMTSLIGLEMTTEETTRERVAKFIDGTASGAELFLPSMIHSNVDLPDPHGLTSITYLVTPKQKGAALPNLETEAQHVVDDKDGAKRLTIIARTPPAPRRQALPIAKPPAELADFLAPDSLLQSDAPEIIALAKQGVGDAKDPWIAAQQLEKLVYRTVSKKNMDTAFASALEVCMSKEGDCSEHAVLLAALCRAAGIPARVAMGLGYIPGMFGGHAWAEVWIDGAWYGLDGTLGVGVADPTHIRLGASSLKGGSFGEAFMGIATGLGTMDLKIVEYARGEKVTKVP